MTILCATCGVETAEPLPETCRICADERQWVPLHGQIWTSVEEQLADGMHIDVVELEPGASPQAVGQRVEQAVPGARFVAHSGMLGPMLRAIRSLTWLALALVVLIAMATAAAVVLAARGARIVSDAAVSRGGCLVESDIGVIDASVESRWRRAAASIGCDEAWIEAPAPEGTEDTTA